jgi:hypothetical protein
MALATSTLLNITILHCIIDNIHTNCHSGQHYKINIKHNCLTQNHSTETIVLLPVNMSSPYYDVAEIQQNYHCVIMIITASLLPRLMTQNHTFSHYLTQCGYYLVTIYTIRSQVIATFLYSLEHLCFFLCLFLIMIFF